MSKNREKILEYVFIGKNFLSIERSMVKKNELLANGYQILRENSKKITFVKYK